MAGYFIERFNWETFFELLEPPATVLAEQAAKYVSRHKAETWLSTFPSDKDLLPNALAEFFASEEWYADKSLEDCGRVDWLLYRILNGNIKVKGLQIKHINSGLSWDVTRVLAKTEPIYGEFGSVPFRHSTFDWAKVSTVNPMTDPNPPHMPMYGLYDPSTVTKLLAAAERGRTSVESSLDEELIENYVEDLIQPLEDAAKRKCGIYVTTDT